MYTLLVLACTEHTLNPVERPRAPDRQDRPDREFDADTGSAEEDPPEDTDPPDEEEPPEEDPPSDDDCWDEHFEPDADISDLKSGFSAGNARSTMEQLFERRFQSAAHLIDEQSHDPYIDIFTETSSWGWFVDSLGTVVHETVHGYDYENSLNGNGGYFRYWFLKSYLPKTPWTDGFARSRIKSRVEGDATELYWLYLEGTQGTYGWVELLDETNCYVNGLGALTVVAEDMPWGTSAIDGPTAFLYFIALYIEEAEENDPAVHARISEPPFQDVVRDLWLRTHFFLQWADDEPKLSVEGERIKKLMYAKEGVIEDYLGYGLDGHCLE